MKLPHSFLSIHSKTKQTRLRVEKSDYESIQNKAKNTGEIGNLQDLQIGINEKVLAPHTTRNCTSLE